MGKMVKFEHNGAQVAIPRRKVIDLWLGGAQPAPTAVTRRATVPPLGQCWPGTTDIYVGSYLDDDNVEHFVVLPVGDEFAKSGVSYGCNGEKIDAESRFNGKANTEAMAAKGSEAAKWALEKGCHIPSLIESNLCFAAARHRFDKDWYLTSTQCGPYNAYVQNFDHGLTIYFYETCKARVRLVRSFTL